MSDEFKILAETLADIKTRFDRLESEYAVQAKPLEAAAASVNAVLAGLRVLETHLLNQPIARLSARVAALEAELANIKSKSQ